MKQETSPAVKSADRTFDILEFVGEAHAPPSFSQMMVRLGIPRSSLFHLLNNMLARGYLERDAASSLYRLGPSIRRLAARIAAPTLAHEVQPFLDNLSRGLNETSGFYIRTGDTVETLASAASTQALAYTMRVGEHAPLHAVSGGKLLLAHMPAEAVEAYLSRADFAPITPATLRSAEDLARQIAAARKDGFAYSREEFTPGITGIATAVTRDGILFGALNLAVPTARFTAERDLVFRRALTGTAAALAKALSTSRTVS